MVKKIFAVLMIVLVLSAVFACCQQEKKNDEPAMMVIITPSHDNPFLKAEAVAADEADKAFGYKTLVLLHSGESNAATFGTFVLSE